MTPIEQKALALVNEERERHNLFPAPYLDHYANFSYAAICRAIEAHEAYKQEVSDAVEDLLDGAVFRKAAHDRLSRFIIPKPVDPLEVVLAEAGYAVFPDDLEKVRAALVKRGLKIVECEG